MTEVEVNFASVLLYHHDKLNAYRSRVLDQSFRGNISTTTDNVYAEHGRPIDSASDTITETTGTCWITSFEGELGCAVAACGTVGGNEQYHG
jgi:hypothetical protein